MPHINLVFLLWYANLGSSVILLVRLVRQDLLRTYPLLCVYLATDIAQQVTGLAVAQLIPQSGVAYIQIYATGQAAKVVLIVFIVLELYRIALREYPAVGRYARNIAGYMILGATLVAGGLMWLTPQTVSGKGRWGRISQYVFGFERAIDSVSFFLLLFMAAFLLWFPVRLSRNIAWCLGCFTAYLCGRWIGLFSMGLRPELTRAIGNGQMTVSFACFLTMAWVMARQGEESTVSPENRWDPRRMQRLRAKLDALEAHLAGLATKHRNISANAALHSSES